MLLEMIMKPSMDQQKFNRVWNYYVYAIKDTYWMNE